MSVKAFRVDFKFTSEDTASMFVIAATPEDAAAGCMQMLKENEQQYGNPEVTTVEEYKKPEEETPAQMLN